MLLTQLCRAVSVVVLLGEDSDYSELLVNAVADGSIARRCAQLEEKVEKEIKNVLTRDRTCAFEVLL